MSEKIGVDITANVSGLDAGYDHAEKRTKEFASTVEKANNDISGASRKAIDALGQVGREAVRGDFSQIPETIGRAAMAAPELSLRLVALLSPFAAVAAVAGVFGKAAYDGAEESRALANALIMTGNAAGTSTDHLNALAVAVSAAAGSTRGAGAAALAQLVSTGRVAEESIGRAAEATLRLERSGAQAMAVTVKQFAELGKSPVEASLKLNEQYNYLTAEVYRQIQALQEEGREREAVTLAQNAYADAVGRMATAVDNNLGVIERSWRSVKDAAKTAWDAMLNIGREKTLTDQLAEIDRQIAAAEKSRVATNSNPAFAGFFGNDAQLAQLRARRDLLLAAKQAQEETLRTTTEQSEKEKAGIAFLQLKDQYLSKEEKLQRELAKIRTEGKAAGASDTEIRQLEEAAREKYATKTPKPQAEKISDYDRLVRSIKEKIAVGELEATQEEKLTESQRLQAKVMSDLANGSLKMTASQRTHIELLLNEAIAIERKNRADEASKKADLILDDYRRINAQTVERIEREAELATMTGEQRVIAEALYKAEDEGAKIRERILRDLPEGIAQTKALAAAEAELAKQKARVTAAAKENYEQQRTFEYGWDKAFRAYEEGATNAAKTAETAFSGMTGAMEDAIKTFVKTGKVDFKSFGDAVINTLIDIQMQSLRTNVLAPMMQSGGNWLSSFFGSLSSSSVPSNADTTIPMQAGGGYHEGGIAGLEPTFTRTVPASAFRNAPRYHGGGISGDEEAAILKKGEGVFTEAQMKKMAPVNSAPVINIINNASGTETTRRSRLGSNGESITDIVINAVKSDLLGDIASGGEFATGLESKYALNRSAGAWR